ncbi:sensor histidine kinase [Jeotgalibacillus aurantiacus]|uniref:sensor histidine kinase n=1 Tax=Jeotgalibacillus aurantiacus TaxID=2763266 RepID=UPI001D09EF0D|nr:sensor histidine kinase [Jeotgalibacillus aurantiacus]
MNKLSLKISLFYLTGLIIILTVSLWLVHDHLVDQQIKNENDQLYQRGVSHRDALETDSSADVIQHVILMERSALSDVTLFDAEGSLIASSLEDPSVVSGWPLKEGIVEADWRSDGYIGSIAMLPDGGAVVMSKSTESLQQLINELNGHFFLAAFLSLVFIVFSVYFLTTLVTRPLLNISHSASQLSKGEVLTMPETNRRDEIGRLSQSIEKISADLHHMKQSRSAFLTSISHELRTPITYIKGYSGLLTKENSEYGEIIHEEANRLQRLTEDLFELAKMEETSFAIRPEEVRMSELIRDAVSRVDQALSEKKISLHYQVGEEITEWLDPIRVEQVFINLLDNAIKYTPASGDIMIRIRKNYCEIEDSGPGIPEGDLPFIFDRFYRVDKSRNRQSGGTGLGLAIVKEIVEAHGGSIEASNSDRGAKFMITWKGEGHEKNSFNG